MAGDILKLVRILRELETIKRKVKALVVNLNDMVDNDLSNLQTEVQIEVNKILDFEKDCG